MRDGRMRRNARKPKTLEGDTASGASQQKADAMAVGTGKREENVCFQEIQSPELWRARRRERMEGKGRMEGGLDFWCIGVLIPTLNYPLSWAQLGPLVKTPPLFVLRSR